MNPDLLGQQLLRSPCQSLNCTYFHSSVLRGSRKQEMRDCKGIKIFLAICPSSCRGKDFLPQSEVSWNLRLSHMSFLLGLLESETEPHELSARAPGIWDWGTWAFCWNCFCCPTFQHAGLLVTSPVLGFLHFQLPPQEISLSWASAVFGLHLVEAEPRLFQPG